METKAEKIQVFDKSYISQIQSVLIKKGFKSIVLNNEKEVKDFVNNKIPDECKVGLGDSITTCKLNLRNILAAKGTTIFYSWDGSDNYNRSLDTFEPPVRPDFYLTRINAITSKGELLIKDYSKKAVENKLYPKKIFAFAGLNRVTEAFDDRESISKYPIFSKCPPKTDFTVILLPFLAY